MTVQEYLQQIKVLDTKIQQKQEQYRRLVEQASGSGGISYDKDVVQTSKTGDRLERLIIQYVDLEKVIQEEQLHFEMMKHTIINQVQSLNEDRYMNVLFKRYIEYKSYELIAVEMSYSFDYVKELHRDALNFFKEKFPTLSHL